MEILQSSHAPGGGTGWMGGGGGGYPQFFLLRRLEQTSTVKIGHQPKIH